MTINSTLHSNQDVPSGLLRLPHGFSISDSNADPLLLVHAIVDCLEMRGFECLLRLKSFWKISYVLTDERCLQFHPDEKPTTYTERVKVSEHSIAFTPHTSHTSGSQTSSGDMVEHCHSLMALLKSERGGVSTLADNSGKKQKGVKNLAVAISLAKENNANSNSFKVKNVLFTGLTTAAVFDYNRLGCILDAGSSTSSLMDFAISSGNSKKRGKRSSAFIDNSGNGMGDYGGLEGLDTPGATAGGGAESASKRKTPTSGSAAKKSRKSPVTTGSGKKGTAIGSGKNGSSASKNEPASLSSGQKKRRKKKRMVASDGESSDNADDEDYME